MNYTNSIHFKYLVFSYGVVIMEERMMKIMKIRDEISVIEKNISHIEQEKVNKQFEVFVAIVAIVILIASGQNPEWYCLH